MSKTMPSNPTDAPGTRLEELRAQLEQYALGVANYPDLVKLAQDILICAEHEREERERLELEANRRLSNAEERNAALRTALDGARADNGRLHKLVEQARNVIDPDEHPQWDRAVTGTLVNCDVKIDKLEKRADALAAENARLRDALTFIEVWNLPMVHSRIDDRDVPYGVDFGSNGERDYMRDVARKALTRPLPPR